MDAYATASSTGARKVLLNFSNLEYMNSSGIGLLVTLLIRANRQGQHIAAFGLSPHYRDIFELTRLDEAIHIYDSEEAALAAA
jgi:anti-sigma B factor antagonist